MSLSRILRYLTGGMEALLGIPLIGGSIVIGFGYTPLFVMFVLHIVTMVICSKERQDKSGSIVGVVTSCIAWIPFVGMIMHIITALILLISASLRSSRRISS